MRTRSPNRMNGVVASPRSMVSSIRFSARQDDPALRSAAQDAGLQVKAITPDDRAGFPLIEFPTECADVYDCSGATGTTSSTSSQMGDWPG